MLSLKAVTPGVAWLAAVVFGLSCADAASINGEAKFVGDIAIRPPIQVTKDQDHCGPTLPDESYSISPNRGLKNVVVYIEQSTNHPLPARKDNILNNSGCRFVPRVIAMMLGERLVVKNNDPKLHIVHSYAEQRTVFNLSLPFRGLSLEATRKIKAPGLLQVKCDAHNWMKAFIHVFSHPFFLVTDERGAFSILNIPQGRYTLKAWHEEAGVRSAEISVPETGEVKVKFEFGKEAWP